MGNKFEIWNINSWEMRQTGGSLSTEILDVVPSRKYQINVILILGEINEF
jgi:hypothetical protein